MSSSKTLSDSEKKNLKWWASEAERLLALGKDREIQLEDFQDKPISWQMVTIEYKEAKYHSYLQGNELSESERQAIATMYEYACVRYTPKRGQKKIVAGETHWERYYEYIRSVAWANKRKEALERAKYKCQLCGFRNTFFEVHHNTYEHLGDEPPEDLIVLCIGCHNRFHNPKGLK